MNDTKHLLLVLLLGYLGLYNGQLALFQQGQSTPEAVLPYRVELFPKADQESLKKGIPFGSEAERNQLLEDFLS